MKPGYLAEFTKTAKEKKRSTVRAGLTYGAYGAAGGAGIAGVSSLRAMHKRSPGVFMTGKGGKLLKKKMLKGGLIGAGILGALGAAGTFIRNRIRE